MINKKILGILVCILFVGASVTPNILVRNVRADPGDEVIKITDNILSDSGASIIQSASGTYYMVYQSGISGTYDHDLYFSKSYDLINWETPSQITTYSGRDTSPSLAEAENGDLLVTFESTQGSPWGWKTYLTRSTDGGYTWSTAVLIEPYCSGNPNILKANDGTLYLSRHRLGSWTKISKSTDNGYTWTLVETISNHPYVLHSVMREYDGNLFMICDSRQDVNPNPSNLYFYKSTDDGDTWVEQSSITSSYEDRAPTFVRTDDGEYIVIWRSDDRGNSGNWDYYYSTSDDFVNWETPQPLIEDPSRNFARAELFKDTDGEIYFVWADDSDGDYEIYLAKFDIFISLYLFDEFNTDFTDNSDGTFKRLNHLLHGKVLTNQFDSAANDKRCATLTFFKNDDHARPVSVPTLQSLSDNCHYGYYWARMKAAECKPDEGIVTGFFTYWNEKIDENKNGIWDNSEIDFEILGFDTTKVFLTIWTDCQWDENGDIIDKKNVHLIVDPGRGKVVEWADDGWTDIGNLQGSIPNFDAAKQYYDYYFHWEEDEVEFWLRDPITGKYLRLWTFDETEKIPTHPTSLLFNIWHTNDWIKGGIPSEDVTTYIDLVEYVPFSNYLKVRADSPIDIHLYDYLSRHVGVNYSNGEIEKTIPGSYYTGNVSEPQLIVIPDPFMEENYQIEVVGTGDGNYLLTVSGRINGQGLIPLVIEDSIEEGERHTITFNIYDLLTLDTTIDIDQDTLNLKSSGNWITCYIEFPEGYNVEDINISTILLNNTVSVEHHPTDIDDYDDDSIPDLMVKFDRQAVQDIVEPGDDVAITITGKLFDGTRFEGVDYIKVI